MSFKVETSVINIETLSDITMPNIETLRDITMPKHRNT